MNDASEKWIVRSKHNRAPASQIKVPAPPAVPTDFARNKQLVFRAKMSVSHDRAQRMIKGYLLVPRYNQQQADRAANVVTACAALRGISLDEVGDWDSLAHCLAHSLYREERQWLVAWSGFVDWGKEDFFEASQLVFGNRFVGEPFIERMDTEGNAMLVMNAPY